jgi:hypothetical protein
VLIGVFSDNSTEYFSLSKLEKKNKFLRYPIRTDSFDSGEGNDPPGKIKIPGAGIG